MAHLLFFLTMADIQTIPHDTSVKLSPYELAGISAGNTLLGSYVNNLYQRFSEERALRHSRELMSEQAKFQYENNLNAGMLEKQSKQRAGLNVNMDGGFSPSLTPPSAQQQPLAPQMSLAPDGAFIQSMMQGQMFGSQASMLEADARQKNADAEKQEILNSRMREEDSLYNLVQLSPTGDLIINSSVMNSPISNKGGFDALNTIRESVAKFREYDARTAQAELQRLISEYQVDNEIFQYMARMPEPQFNLLWSNVDVQDALRTVYISEAGKNDAQKELFVSEKELNDLQKKIQEDSNISRILEQISKDFENGDYLKALGGVLKGLLFAGLQTAGVHFGFNFGRNKSSSTTSNTSTVSSRSHSDVTVHSGK